MKILLISQEDRPLRKISEEYEQKIKAVDSSIDLEIVSTSDTEGIKEHIVDADVVAGAPRALPSLESAKNLKWIHSFSAGMDRVLTPEIVSSDIIASNSSGIHATPIAEHVIGFMLLFTKQFRKTFKQQEQKIWQRVDGLTELRDKEVLILGLGNIGEEVARLSAAFGAHVSAIDTAEGKPDFVEKLGSPDQLSDMLPTPDFVVIALPLTDATHHLINADAFSQMKDSSVVVNIGRGSIIDEKALIKALKDRQIAGAALDVTEEEPLDENSSLWGMDNVVITPHHSGISERYMERAVDLFCENIKAYIAGEPLLTLVDKEKGY